MQLNTSINTKCGLAVYNDTKLYKTSIQSWKTFYVRAATAKRQSRNNFMLTIHYLITSVKITS